MSIKLIPIALVFVLVHMLAGCGNSSDGTTPAQATPPIVSFELTDPTPGVGDRFGQHVVILPNGNIIVSDPGDSSLVSTNLNGAVHLYNPVTQSLIASIYGDDGGDQLGAGGITALSNNNFVIASPFDNVAGVLNGGSVRLVDGETGAQIGSITGNNAQDRLGSGGITALTNNNFVVVSPDDDHGAVINAGSVRLVDGISGVQIGIPIFGDSPDDAPGWSRISKFNIPNFKGVTALPNNNYVIASPDDDVGVTIDAGTVRLMDGVSGSQIGNVILGSVAEDHVGSGGIAVLPNNNYVIVSPDDDVAGIVNAGSVRLLNGSTGMQISPLNGIAGDVAEDQLGSSGVFALPNNNYVIASPLDNERGVTDAGSIRLVNGVNGVLIGNVITGDTPTDLLGSSGIAVLSNNNFVVSSMFDSESGLVNVGSVRLVDGTSANQIGSIITGDMPGDQLGSGGAIALPNNNYVIASPTDDEGGVAEAGSVRLVDGASGTQIGPTMTGKANNDRLGSNGITVLANDNYVIASQFTDMAGIVDAGSVQLVNGLSGVQIGTTIAGDMLEDQIGSISVTALVDNNFVVISHRVDAGGLVDAGSALKVNGATGAQVGNKITGTSAFDLSQGVASSSPNGEFYILSSDAADNNGLIDSGMVRLIAQ